MDVKKKKISSPLLFLPPEQRGYSVSCPCPRKFSHAAVLLWNCFSVFPDFVLSLLEVLDIPDPMGFEDLEPEPVGLAETCGLVLLTVKKIWN